MRVRPADLLLGSLLVLAVSAGAEPLDLRDPTPRWVDVAFEVSPRDLPTQMDSVYTDKLPARLALGAEPGQVVVRVDRDYVEGILFAADEPEPGSFSDFVWVFDANTGEVMSASLSGTVSQPLNWGFFRTRARTHLSAEMASDRVAGVAEPRRWLGNQVFAYCDDPSDAGCRPVPGRKYDPATGYVHAVGPLAARTSEVSVETYSPLGEAIFSERGSPEIAQSPPGCTEATSHPAVVEAEAPLAPVPASGPAVSSGPPIEP